MKRFIIFTFTFFLFTHVFSQEIEDSVESYDFYCRVTACSKQSLRSNDLYAIISFDEYSDVKLCDVNGDIIYFKTTPQIMTYMSKLGWNIVEIHHFGGDIITFKKKVKNI